MRWDRGILHDTSCFFACYREFDSWRSTDWSGSVSSALIDVRLATTREESQWIDPWAHFCVHESGEHQHPLGFHDFHRTECITVELWNCSQEPTGHLDVDNIKWLLGLIRLNIFLVSLAMCRTKALIQSDFFYCSWLIDFWGSWLIMKCPNFQRDTVGVYLGWLLNLCWM